MNTIARGGRQVAAFFDIDGTLLAPPSLEWQFLAGLRAQRAIPMRNYLFWLARGIQLLPRGFRRMQHANKMYLHGVRIHGSSEGQCGQPYRESRGRAETAVPRFFPEAIERIAWHATQGHAIVLVSGTLAPLAAEVALALLVRLAVRGVAMAMTVCATRLEESGGRWTGRIAGEAMFDEAKGRAVRRLIREKQFDAQRCFAYGDNWTDRWMLEAVGHPAAVNPAWRLARFARRKKWPVLLWARKKNSPQSSQSEPKAEGIWEKAG
jgi:HAD superfamily hydrolase (TIGR01490 family)